jgi:hypothetical protein
MRQLGLVLIAPIRRSWWAHFKFTRINTAPTILRKKIEDLRVSRVFQLAGQVKSL